MVRDAFYKGEIAKKILDAMKRHGGVMTAAGPGRIFERVGGTDFDHIPRLDGFRIAAQRPGAGGARDAEHHGEISAGARKDWGFGSVNALHTMIEAKKLAYADLSKYIGDPRQQKLPVATLLSKEWAEKRAKLIDAEHANCSVAAAKFRPEATPHI